MISEKHLVSVLAAHVLRPAFDLPSGYRCSCGHDALGVLPGSGHRDHLAAVLYGELT